jgi:hypothetical protein
MADPHYFLQPALSAATQVATDKANQAKLDAATDATNKANAVMQAATQAAAATPSRLRAKRIAVPAMAAGASQVVQVVWDTPFPSANYTVPCPGVAGTTLLSLPTVSNITKEGCTITVKNAGLLTLAANTATLHVQATHDPIV